MNAEINQPIKHAPRELLGPRTYFTLLDKKNIQQRNDWKIYKNEIDRFLKVLLLTKKTIVVAGSALCSEESLEYFSEQGKYIFLKNGIIKPALQSKFNTFNDLFEDAKDNKNLNISHEVNDFFSNNISEIIGWDLARCSKWLHEQLRDQIIRKSSYFRKYCSKSGYRSEVLFLSIINEYEKSNVGLFYDRERLSRIFESNFKQKVSSKLIQFTDILYYVSGAKAINCDTFLDKSNFTNSISIMYPNKNKLFLSDEDIFFNIVLEIVLSNISECTLNSDIISNLTFSEIIELRETNIFNNEGFMNKYDKCLMLAREFYHKKKKDKESIIDDISELSILSDELYRQFEITILNELGAFKSKQKIKKSIDYCFSLSSQLLGLFLIPVSIINLMFTDVQFNNLNYIKKCKNTFGTIKEKIIRLYIKNKYNDDAVLLSFFYEILKKHKSKYLKELI